MPRRGFIPKREVLPDPVYGNTVVTKLINQIMLDGKRGIAQSVCYQAFENVAALDKFGYVDSDESCLTKTAGVFTAGDCRKKAIRQITTATADGAVAALAACRYIDGM